MWSSFSPQPPLSSHGKHPTNILGQAGNGAAWKVLLDKYMFAQCTLYTSNLALHTAHCTMHPAPCTLHHTLCTARWPLYNAHFTLYTLRLKLINTQFTLHNSHCTLHNAMCRFNNMYCTLPYHIQKGPHCKWHNVNFWPPNLCLMFTTQYTLDSTPYTLQIMHCNGTLRALHSANCTIHLALWANVTFSPLVWNDCKKQPVTVKCLQSCITGTLSLR